MKGDDLRVVATSLDNGTALTPSQITMLGRFDAMIDSMLDGGYERADQLYRNSAKALAAVFAIGLAIVGEGLIEAAQKAQCQAATKAVPAAAHLPRRPSNVWAATL